MLRGVAGTSGSIYISSSCLTSSFKKSIVGRVLLSVLLSSGLHDLITLYKQTCEYLFDLFIKVQAMFVQRAQHDGLE